MSGSRDKTTDIEYTRWKVTNELRGGGWLEVNRRGRHVYLDLVYRSDLSPPGTWVRESICDFAEEPDLCNSIIDLLVSSYVISEDTANKLRERAMQFLGKVGALLALEEKRNYGRGCPSNGLISWGSIKELMAIAHCGLTKMNLCMRRNMAVAILRDGENGLAHTIFASLSGNPPLAYAVISAASDFNPDSDDRVRIHSVIIYNGEFKKFRVIKPRTTECYVSLNELRQRNDVLLTITPRVVQA